MDYIKLSLVPTEPLLLSHCHKRCRLWIQLLTSNLAARLRSQRTLLHLASPHAV